MNIKTLANSIAVIDAAFKRSASQSVNRALTFRNWMIGFYIFEYEQKGNDRAKYGKNLIPNLSGKLKSLKKRGFSERNLQLFREFYRSYPQISQLVIAELPNIKFEGVISLKIPQLATAELVSNENTQKTDISPDPNKLISHFSFTHFAELMKIDNPLKRAFYEIEGIKGAWNVQQLKRQIETQLYERTGLSKDKKGVVASAHMENRTAAVDEIFRDPYILEFAGIPERHQYSENDLEKALLDHLQSFMLELGNGFCFEARQKRITLDNEHDRIDLIFYHRILKCHVLIDLKVRKFRQGDAGQMNFYLNYFRENIVVKGDNPPIGLILCTHRDETRVKYATAGMDNKLLVSKYKTTLPSEERITSFLEGERDRVEMILRESRPEYYPEKHS